MRGAFAVVWVDASFFDARRVVDAAWSVDIACSVFSSEQTIIALVRARSEIKRGLVIKMPING